MQLSSPGLRLAAGLTVGCLALAGCASGTDSSTGSGSPSAAVASSTPSAAVSSSTPSASSAAPSATASGPGASGTTTTPAVPRCTSSDVAITLGPGDGAAGSVYSQLRMTNTSGAACRTGGYGGVSYVARRGGAQVGAAADRVHRDQVRQLTVRPGGFVEATLREVNADNYPRSECRPTKVAGLRVYPPDETRSLFVRHATRGCAATTVHLLELAPYAHVG
jgi:hypothetical protein